MCARLSTGSWPGADLQLSHIIGPEASVMGKQEGETGHRKPVTMQWLPNGQAQPGNFLSDTGRTGSRK